MRPTLITLAVLAALGAAGGASVVAFGLYNVSAQAGHWPGVSWVLHTTFRNSVGLRAPSMEDAPPLDDPDLIALGAGHYATSCAPCHAAPDETRSATMTAMLPAPPGIAEAVADWEPNELHWIVENGIKMSGMPGWPAKERGDEVWAIVAYLTAIQRQAAPPLPEATEGEAYCATCHSQVAGRVPRLDILDPAYMEAQLDAYLSGARPSGIMAQAASRVPQESFGFLSRRMAAADAPPARESAAPSPEGEALARRGTRDVPACLACHGSAETGPARKGPALDGQHRAYLAAQLQLWRDGVLDHDPLMHAATQDLTDAQIDSLAHYFSNRPAGAAPRD